jgi:hypothetical protein
VHEIIIFVLHLAPCAAGGTSIFTSIALSVISKSFICDLQARRISFRRGGISIVLQESSSDEEALSVISKKKILLQKRGHKHCSPRILSRRGGLISVLQEPPSDEGGLICVLQESPSDEGALAS